MKLTERQRKIFIFAASLLLVAIITLLYFLDDSLVWNGIKISSCIVVDWWALFVIPSFRYVYLKYKDMDVKTSIRIGLNIAINGIMLPIIIAPYYGTKYYFQK